MAQVQLESEVEFFRGYKYVLSNFFRFDLKFEGQRYHSVEQAYQAKKATVYGDEDAKRRIMFTTNAGKAWLIGKDIKVNDDWPQMRVEVMKELLKAKLEQCPTYYRKLLSCRGLIVEAVPNQLFWSAGMEKEELVKLSRDQWPGENKLGKLHMKLRDQIRKRKIEVELPKAKRPRTDGSNTSPSSDAPRPEKIAASSADHFDSPTLFDLAANSVNLFDTPHPLMPAGEPTPPPNSPEVDDVWAKVLPEEDDAIAQFLDSVAKEVDIKLEQNSEYKLFFYYFAMKCCWCTFERELIPGKQFCKGCGEQGRECNYCHRPMPDKFFKLHDTRCNSCFKKSEKQKNKRRLGVILS